MPLTRNQQAALQAGGTAPHGPTDGHLQGAVLDRDVFSVAQEATSPFRARDMDPEVGEPSSSRQCAGLDGSFGMPPRQDALSTPERQRYSLRRGRASQPISPKSRAHPGNTDYGGPRAAADIDVSHYSAVLAQHQVPATRSGRKPREQHNQQQGSLQQSHADGHSGQHAALQGHGRADLQGQHGSMSSRDGSVLSGLPEPARQPDGLTHTQQFQGQNISPFQVPVFNGQNAPQFYVQGGGPNAVSAQGNNDGVLGGQHVATARQQPISDADFAALHAQMSNHATPQRSISGPLPHHVEGIHAPLFGQRMAAMQGSPPHGPRDNSHPLGLPSGQPAMLGVPMQPPATVPRGSSHSAHHPSHADQHARTFSTDGIDMMLAAQQRDLNARRGFPPGFDGAHQFLPNSVAHLHAGGPVAMHRPMPSVEGGVAMEYEAADPRFAMMNGSPVSHTTMDGRMNARDAQRAMHRQNASLGPSGTPMNAGMHEALHGNHAQLASLAHFRALQQQQQQHPGMHMSGIGTSSFRSLSGSDGTFGSGTFFGNLSPHSSITTERYAGDSSIDTSTDSISNSATTMSAVPSQASSISDDILSLSSGSRRAIKGKTRLRNIDRKAICEAARMDPKIRQEDLAARFGIERSTVSKTLKNKEKWLAIDDDSEGALIVKHRTGKFPDVEEKLHAWLMREHPNAALPDSLIRSRSLDIAREAGLGPDQFKASLGWIEKFRERYRMPKPVVPECNLLDAQHQSQPFKSMVTLSAQLSDTGRYVDEVGSVGIQQGEGSGTEPAEDNDVPMHLSPPYRTSSTEGMAALPSATTPQSGRSTSNEGHVMILHETPKASKRHYDEAALLGRADQLLNADLGHAKVSSGFDGSAEDGAQGQSGSAQLDDVMSMEEYLQDPPSSAAKRRRAGQEAPMYDQNGLNSSPLAGREGRLLPNADVGRAQLRRKTSDLHSVNGRSDSMESGPDAQDSPSARVSQMHSSKLPGNATAEQSQPTMQNGDAGGSSTPLDAQEALRQQSLSGLLSSQLGGPGGISHSALASTVSMLSDQSSGQQPAEQRQVSVDEARESLRVLFSFASGRSGPMSGAEVHLVDNLQSVLRQLASSSNAPSQDGLSSVAGMSSSSHSHGITSIDPSQQHQVAHQIGHSDAGDGAMPYRP